jgi:hypothetical protein
VEALENTENYSYKERICRVSLTEIRVFFNLKWSKAASRAWSYPENSLKFPISPASVDFWAFIELTITGRNPHCVVDIKSTI